MKAFFRNYLLGPLVASIAAGVVFVFTNLTASMLVDGNGFVMNEPLPEMIFKWLYITGLFVAFGTVLGFLYSIVPNLIGNAIMRAVGHRVAAARAALAWALVGGLAAGVPAVLIAPSDEQLPLTIAFTVTGAACALICRRFARWDEAVAQG